MDNTAMLDLLHQKAPIIPEVMGSWLTARASRFSVDGGALVTSDESYAENFGVQWNRFPLTQITSSEGTETRLFGGSGWSTKDISGSLVLELGSGAGRFTRVLLQAGAIIVSFEMSSAARANARNNSSRNLLVVQGDFFELADLGSKFDFVLGYGVAQHTPKPEEFYRLATSLAKKGTGKVSIDHYAVRFLPSAFYHPKYLWRPITKRMPAKTLLSWVESYVPRYLAVDTFILRMFGRRLGDFVRGLIPIPIWNYYGASGFPQDPESLLEWAILDTFDALGARYDKPATRRYLEAIGRRLGYPYQIERGGNGWVFNAYP